MFLEYVFHEQNYPIISRILNHKFSLHYKIYSGIRKSGITEFS